MFCCHVAFKQQGFVLQQGHLCCLAAQLARKHSQCSVCRPGPQKTFRRQQSSLPSYASEGACRQAAMIIAHKRILAAI